MNKIILATLLALAITGCKKDVLTGPTDIPTDPNEPQLPVKIVSASFSASDDYTGKVVTDDVKSKCSEPPVIGHCDYTPVTNAYTYAPGASYVTYSSRFTVIYTCGSDPAPFYVTFGDNGMTPPTSENDALGKVLRISCSGKPYDANKRITVISASIGNISAKPTTDTQMMCDGSIGACNYWVDPSWIGDPYPNRSKRMTIRYKCGGVEQPVVEKGQNNLPITATNDASGKVMTLTCP